MSEVRVNNLTNENNTGGPTISGITTYSGRHFFVPPRGDTASRPEDCEPGSLRFNTDSAHLEYFKGNTIGWVEVDASSPELGGGTGSNENALGARAISGGGFLGIRTIEFVTVSTFGDSQDFGDLTAAGAIHGKQGVCTETRMLFSGGYINNAIEFITVASTGNSTDFGDMSFRRYAQTGVNDTIRGIFCGGASTTPFVPSHGGVTNVIEYVTIAQTGNGQAGNSTRMLILCGDLNPQGGPIHGNIASITIASTGHSSDSGNDMTQARRLCAQFSNSTRACAAGGYEPTTNIIDFTTISSLSAGVDFGDLSSAKYFQSGSSSSTRGLIIKTNSTNTIEFVTISTTGNAQDFGDTQVVGQALGIANNSTRIVIAEGGSPSLTNTISFITTATTGNAIDFGDLVGDNRRDGVGTSSPTRGVFSCGYDTSNHHDEQDAVELATTGNSVNFGDTVNGNRFRLSGGSSGHGGLG